MTTGATLAAIRPLRQVARRLATGVTVVATHTDTGVHAMTANSFVTLSLAPPLIGVAIGRAGRFRALLSRSSRFGVSILSRTQAPYAAYFANQDRESGQPAPPFQSLGAPIVPDCIGHFVCAVQSIQPVGDHDLIVGEVITCVLGATQEEPLIFLDGKFQL